MRIAQIVASLDQRHGGPSVSVRALARTLAGLDQQVELLATGDTVPPPSANDGRVRVFPCRAPLRLCRSPALADHLASNEFDCVHHHGLWLRPLHYAHAAAARVGVPLVISPRGMMSPWAWRHRRWRKKIAEHCVHPGAFRAAAGWHATSDDEAADIRRLGFTQPVCVAPNGVDAPDDAELTRFRAHWLALAPAAAERRVALFYSRFHSKKRVLELIDLWLAQAPPDWLLLVVGIPESYSVPQLRERARSGDGRGRVEIFAGSGQPPPYAAASLFLLPSHSENFGLVVAEALAAGVPVLVTDTTPWKETAARQAGWCVPWAEFPEALRAACAESAEALQARGQRGRAWMRASFSWETSARRLLEFYERIRSANTSAPR